MVFVLLDSTNVVMNYTEIEAKVREATNDDTWGPHGTIMAEIARYTYTYEHFPEVMSMLWKRMLHENKKNWRRIYKVWTYLCYFTLICFISQLINRKGVSTFVLVAAASHLPGQEWIGTSCHQHKRPHLRFKAIGKL